jgi:hypothetical protein
VKLDQTRWSNFNQLTRHHHFHKKTGRNQRVSHRRFGVLRQCILRCAAPLKAHAHATRMAAYRVAMAAATPDASGWNRRREGADPCQPFLQSALSARAAFHEFNESAIGSMGYGSGLVSHAAAMAAAATARERFCCSGRQAWSLQRAALGPQVAARWTLVSGARRGVETCAAFFGFFLWF